MGCIVVVQILTLTPGLLQNDDGALYLTHARNIALGRPYFETQFIYTPETALYSPSSYPPVWPLVLAPIYFFFGLAPDPYKWLNIGILTLLVLVVWQTYRSNVSPGAGMALAALLGFNPYLAGLKNTIYSDLLFLLLAFWALHTARKRLAVLCGTTIYLAYGTRPIGVFVLLAVILADTFNQKRLSGFSLRVGLIATSLILLQNLIFRSESDYIALATLQGHTLQQNLRFYIGTLSIYLAGEMNIVVRSLTLSMVCGLTLVGIWHSVRVRLEAEHVFLATYGLFLLWWPVHQARYLLPLLPIFLFFAVQSTKRYELLFIPLIFVALTASIGWRPEIKEQVPLKFYHRVKAELPPNSVLIGGAARELALYAERRAARYAQTENMREYLRRLLATHLFTSNQDPTDWKRLAESLGHPLFEEDGITLWELNTKLLQESDSSAEPIR